MAYSQLGYFTTPQFLMTSDSLTSLESDGTSLTDTVTPPFHAALSCPVYEGRVLRSPSLDLPMGCDGVYGTYPKSQSYYSTCSGDTPSLYPRDSPDSKDGAISVNMGTSQAPAYYPYEYTLSQYSYDRYSYSTSEGASRRKNATRETTSTLKAWLQEHQKNPYPTKGEKIMLAIITRMTLTQVSTWFANARRRLKKENKVTWSPRASKSADDRGCDDDSDGAEEPVITDHKSTQPQSDLEDFDLLESEGSDCEPKRPTLTKDISTNIAAAISPRQRTANPDTPHRKERSSPDFPELTAAHSHNMGHPGSDTKPKIWSIARTAIILEEEYPPCMLFSSRAPPPGHPAEQQSSSVTSLREWVDGVFQETAFQHRALTHALPGPDTEWKGPNDATLHSGTHSYEHISTSSL